MSVGKRSKGKAKGTSSKLEREFDAYALSLGLPEAVKQYRFYPPRRFRFDRCYMDQMVAIELDGGVYSGGGHVRGKGYESNREKDNLAIELGWVVLHYTSKQLRSNPFGVVEQIKRVFVMRAWTPEIPEFVNVDQEKISRELDRSN